MLTLVLVLAAIQADPLEKTIPLATYVSEVQAVVYKADGFKTPRAKQAALVKGVNALNQRYAKSQERIVLTFPVTTATQGGARNIARINLSPAEEIAHDESLTTRSLIAVPIPRGTASRLMGGKIILSGIPVLSDVAQESDCSITVETLMLHIHLFARQVQAVNRDGL